MNNSRAIWIIIFVFVAFATLVARLFDIQIIRSEELKYYAKRQQTIVEKIKAERGLIYDRNNVLLAYDRNDVSFFLDLRMVSDKNKKIIANKFSSVFGEPVKHYEDLMSASGKTICLEKKAPSEKAVLLKNFKATGLFHTDDPTRVYNYNELASYVLGYVGSDYQGVDGVAKYYDNILAGQDGSMVVLRDAIGDMITVEEKETKPAVPGINLVLTIDKNYQQILEEELNEGVKKYGGKSAVGIIMDPNNGEILALANSGGFNPNKYWSYSDTARRDRAITDTYEPGSTFKSFSMAALLDKNLVNENDEVFAENGKYKFENVFITDAHKSGWLSARQVIEESSNIGMSKLTQKIDDDTFYKYIRAFGFGNYTSIDLPGEVKGMLRKPNLWTPISKAFLSFGYGLSVTPIQIATAYCALINGGILYQPQIVKKEIRRDGTIVEEKNPIQVRRVISAATSERIKQLLVDVVKEGTGTEASLENISVGGKTGTSQKLIDNHYSKEFYNSSFVGFFPVQNPKIVCLILVNSPTIGRYGGLVAAPIFKNVAERIINLNPSNFETYPQSIQPESQNFKVAYTGSSNQDKTENPTKKLSNTVLQSSFMNIKSGLMPDLHEYSMRDAIILLLKLGLKCKINGSGNVISQSITPGVNIHKGDLCVVDCKEPDLTGATVY
ncbi:MAG: penicillin-binding transpeptidase domain-containing protein [Ignavibacteriaceae bacterium]